MPTIEISDETFAKIKDQLEEEDVVDVEDYEDFVGQKMFMRTVTYHMLGKVTKIVGNFAQMEESSYIGCTPRFSNFIKDGELDEVEPVGTCWVNLKSVTDMFPWKHKLPKKQS